MNVKQLMSTNTVVIDQHASCREAAALMARHKVRHLPVVSGDGRLAGIVTDRDLRHHLFRPDVFPTIGRVPVDQILTEVPVHRIMSTPVVSVDPELGLEHAARRMREARLGSLPVVEDGRVVGILTETDLLRRIVGGEAACTEVDTIVVSYP
jgi:CBS domain-containing protein